MAASSTRAIYFAIGNSTTIAINKSSQSRGS